MEPEPKSRRRTWILLLVPIWYLTLDYFLYSIVGDHLLSFRTLAAIPVLPGIIAATPIGLWKSLALAVLILIIVSIGLIRPTKRLVKLMQTQFPIQIGVWTVWFGLMCLPFLFSGQTQRRTNTQHAHVIPETDRQRRLREIRLMNVASVPESPADGVIVIVESFRHELVNAETMPNLHRAATEGHWFRNHCSGGNATSHGMFSLLTGMEATWFDTSLRFSPPLYRLFRGSGFEIGFFAGHDDWRLFHMDGLVDAGHFDVCETTAQSGLDSDRGSVRRAIDFLRPERDDVQRRPPRLAIVYLYATHAPYLSYASDQHFQPAADDRFLMPYSREQRTAVWNRYQNSARTVDRWIGKLMEGSNRWILVTGDHGEAFLEDGTIGHGTKISIVQNRTPAVIWGKGVTPKVVDQTTMHADLLPTLTTVAGIEINGASSIDGRDLTQDQIDNRTLFTRDYLSDDVMPIEALTN